MKDFFFFHTVVPRSSPAQCALRSQSGPFCGLLFTAFSTSCCQRFDAQLFGVLFLRRLRLRLPLSSRSCRCGVFSTFLVTTEQRARRLESWDDGVMISSPPRHAMPGSWRSFLHKVPFWSLPRVLTENPIAVVPRFDGAVLQEARRKVRRILSSLTPAVAPESSSWFQTWEASGLRRRAVSSVFWPAPRSASSPRSSGFAPSSFGTPVGVHALLRCRKGSGFVASGYPRSPGADGERHPRPTPLSNGVICPPLRSVTGCDVDVLSVAMRIVRASPSVFHLFKEEPGPHPGCESQWPRSCRGRSALLIAQSQRQVPQARTLAGC